MLTCFTTLWIYTILKLNRRHRPAIRVLLPYGFTLFSNHWMANSFACNVLLPYGFTLFSNTPPCTVLLFKFYYLMDLHYSQTENQSMIRSEVFYYLMDLHYSQTKLHAALPYPSFYYLMDLHYSQTGIKEEIAIFLFYYLMDLHYSQTMRRFFIL